jgi:hypothetical protein
MLIILDQIFFANLCKGIGPAETLEEAGIQPYVINENVGKK